jgi:hypothetical protein
LDANVDDPIIQAKALNGLGNIYYLRANQFLDQRNIAEARKSWVQSINHYESSLLIDGNVKAKQNLESLNKQIQERINALICKITGKIWRDINGDGKLQKTEPDLQGFVFWDKDEMANTIKPLNQLFKVMTKVFFHLNGYPTNTQHQFDWEQN